MNNAMAGKMPTTFLVTGASGFVGGGLASRLLREGNRVVCLVRDGHAPSGAEIVRGDLSSYEDCCRAVTKAGPSAGVFHLGAQAKVEYGINNTLETFESNVRGTYNLLEAVRRHTPWAPVVVASSDKAYGHLPSGEYTEDMPMAGLGYYDVSKSCTDLIAQSYAHHGLDVAIVRAGNIYGPGDLDLSRIVPSVCNDLCRGRGPVIRSDGTPIRDYLFCADALDGYQALMGALSTNATWVRGRGYNLSGGDPTSVLDLTREMVRIWENKGYNTFARDLSPVVEGTRTGEIQYQVLNCLRASVEIGWNPKHSLLAGLTHTIDWWRNDRRRGL